MRRLSMLLLFAATAWLACAQGQSPKDVPSAASPDKPAGVQVKTVVKVFLKDGAPGYSIAYDYDFPERETVYIDHIGVVPAKGSFHYISEGTRLEVRESPDGKILAEVPLRETVIVAAKPPVLGVPDEDAFPNVYQSFIWDSKRSLTERANNVLNKAFHYHPQFEQGVTRLKTTFTPLPPEGLSAGTTAQIALLLSFPFDPESGRYSLHVQSLVMEGRSHSDRFEPTSNPVILHSADDFVRHLVAEMKTGKEE
jgi:hypothetical protein